jgi:alpha-galactosidase
MLGTYDLMGRIVDAHPDLLLENCSGGGGRFDPGMLYYSPQIWCSDETDPIERLSIQFGTSVCYPTATMGAHVSANPRTGFATKANVAMWGTFGYELDPGKLDDGERAKLREQVAFANETQLLRLYGRRYWLQSPFEGNDAAWMSVSEDRTEAMFTLVRRMARPNEMPPLVRLQGLDADRRYRVVETGEVFGGDELMLSGLCCPLGTGDAAALVYRLRAGT